MVAYRRAELRIETGRSWNRPQWDFISWRAPPYSDGVPRTEHIGGVGQYGGGKTSAGAARFLLCACENGFIEGEHTEKRPPRSGIIGPSIAMVKAGALAELSMVLPPALVLDTRLYGEYQDITLVNGHRIQLYSLEGALDGPSLCGIWADEIQKPGYAAPGVWRNIRKRVREATAKRLNVQATGLAQPGLPERLFRGTEDINHRTVMFKTSDNAKNLARGTLDDRMDALPSSDTATDEDGWSLVEGACWPNWSALNTARAPALGDREGLITHLGIDLGRKASVVFGQDEPVDIVRPFEGKTRNERGLLVVDQLIIDRRSAAEIVKEMRRLPRYTRWRIGPGSVMCFDPTASIDEIRPFVEAFPSARVVQVTHGPNYDSATGRRTVGRAIKDASGNVRVFVHPWLVGQHERGLPESLRLYLDTKLKDDRFEHSADAGRYLIVERCPNPDFTWSSAINLDPDFGLRGDA